MVNLFFTLNIKLAENFGVIETLNFFLFRFLSPKKLVIF